MEGLDYWRLCDELTVIQAALLIAGDDPSSAQEYVEQWEPAKRPLGYEAAKAAISHALRCGEIEGTWIRLPAESVGGYVYLTGEIEDPKGLIDIARSRVEVDSLRKWLSRRGRRTGFFFPKTKDEPDYLDPGNSRYAPKLAAAVRAWQAVTDPAGKHPKQALMKWLREKRVRFRING